MKFKALKEDGLGKLIELTKGALNEEKQDRIAGDTANKNEIDNLKSTKVDKEDGKGLSTNDFTDAEKSKLESIETGAEVNKIVNIKTVDGSILTITEKEVTLPDYALKSDIATLYRPKGSLANLDAIKGVKNKSVGDVYNAEDTGMNYAWTGSKWDELGSIIDLTPYSTTEESDRRYVAKEDGKGLSTNDFTNIEKEKLANIPERGNIIKAIVTVDTAKEEPNKIGVSSVDNYTPANNDLIRVVFVSGASTSAPMTLKIGETPTKPVYTGVIPTAKDTLNLDAGNASVLMWYDLMNDRWQLFGSTENNTYVGITDEDLENGTSESPHTISAKQFKSQLDKVKSSVYSEIEEKMRVWIPKITTDGLVFKNVYISATGDDNNFGEVEGSPIKTLAKLKEKLSGKYEGIKIYVTGEIAPDDNVRELKPRSGTAVELHMSDGAKLPVDLLFNYNILSIQGTFEQPDKNISLYQTSLKAEDKAVIKVGKLSLIRSDVVMKPTATSDIICRNLLIDQTEVSLDNTKLEITPNTLSDQVRIINSKVAMNRDSVWKIAPTIDNAVVSLDNSHIHIAKEVELAEGRTLNVSSEGNEFIPMNFFPESFTKYSDKPNYGVRDYNSVKELLSGDISPEAPPTSQESSFAELKRLLDYSLITAKEKYPVGTIIPDTWTDPQTGTVYQAPLMVVHYGDCELANGTTKNGVYLIRKTVLPFTLEFDAAEPENPNSERRSAGNNRYAHSAIHQYLNSDKEKNTWWEKKHQYDSAPDYASTRDGYLKGCSPELLSAISEVKVAVHTAQIDSSAIDKVSGKFFLPSLENLNFITGNNDTASTGVEGPVWEYYKTIGSPTDGPNTKRIFDFAGVQNSFLWLRSAYRAYSYNVHAVDWNGSSTNRSVYKSHVVAPACVITSNSEI